MEKTLSNGLAVLEQLSRAEGPMRLTALSQALGLAKSNTHRLLSTLSALGYVEQEAETERYQPTLKAWELGAGVIARHPAKRFAMPYLQELHRLTDETVTLSVLAGDEVLYLDKITSRRPLRTTAQPGTRAPAPLTASGKALIAGHPLALEIATRARERDPRAAGLDLDALMRELETVRRRGYAEADGDWLEGVVSLAAPVLGRPGRPAAAITLSGPTERMGAERRAAMVQAVLGVCARLAEEVGPV